MMTYIVVFVGSLLVGMSIGWCGIAGFLLPVLFMNYCGLDSNAALFISFLCFSISGLLGAKNYAKRGELPVQQGMLLGISSLFGSVAGAMLGQYFVSGYMKTILYCVVLFSGISILFQEFVLKKQVKQKVSGSSEGEKSISKAVLVSVGILTSLLCALSGAGGPVLVMPILVLLGMQIKAAIGTALLDSLFIALPAIVVYGSKADILSLIPLLLLAFISHMIGIEIGSRTAEKIPQTPLKRGIAVGSIAFAIFMLLRYLV